LNSILTHDSLAKHGVSRNEKPYFRCRFAFTRRGSAGAR
jgi:hypothetical protein